MKPLDELTNTEKAKLLYALFPSEIPAFLQFLQTACRTIDMEKDIIKIEWDNQLLTSDFWFDLSNKANGIIQRYGNKLEKRRCLFARQFFEGAIVIFIVDSLSKYSTSNSNHPKFAKAVELLFN